MWRVKDLVSRLINPIGLGSGVEGTCKSLKMHQRSAFSVLHLP